MFDLEKFKTGNYYVHLPTQELYNKAMKFLEENGVSWQRFKATDKQFWEEYKKETAINFEEYIYYADKPYYEEEGFKELPINRKEDYSDTLKGLAILWNYIKRNKPEEDNEVEAIVPLPKQATNTNNMVKSPNQPSNEERYTKIMLENKEIYLDKNKKYGDAFAETVKKYGYISALTRMNDKFNRIEQFVIEGFEDEEESLRDSLMDLANYCYMFVMELDNE